VLPGQFAVCAGGWTLAAEADCAGDGLPAEAVLDHLGGLVAKSLVGAEHDLWTVGLPVTCWQPAFNRPGRP
jgi:hypothetical protein